MNAATTHDYSYGVHASTTGNNSGGVYAKTTGDGSDGVHAYSANSYGVYGKGKYGGYFTTNQGGELVGLLRNPNAAVNAATTYNYSDGVRASTTGGGSTGVYAHTTGYGSRGVYVFTYGDDSDGVRAHSDKGNGVFGETSDSASHAGYFTTAAGQRLNGATVYAHNSNSHGIALYARNDASDDVTAAFINGGTGYLMKGFGGDGGNHEFAVHNDGKVWTEGGVHVVGNARVTTPILEITGGSDLSEQFEIREIMTDLLPSPGMVVSIDPENLGDLVVSNNTYDRRVAGIISGAGGIKPGMLMGQSGSVADGEYPVALTGRVYCWADASNSPIEPGDLLTTSDTPGHAMKVTDYTRAQGAVIGKAMSSLDEGQGLVLVLVTLQ
jgi:hypothetical protein